MKTSFSDICLGFLALILTAFVSSSLVYASCASLPACSALGYTQTAADCASFPYIKCPYDTSKVACQTTNLDCTAFGFKNQDYQCLTSDGDRGGELCNPVRVTPESPYCIQRIYCTDLIIVSTSDLLIRLKKQISGERELFAYAPDKSITSYSGYNYKRIKLENMEKYTLKMRNINNSNDYPLQCDILNKNSEAYCTKKTIYNDEKLKELAISECGTHENSYTTFCDLIIFVPSCLDEEMLALTFDLK